MLRIDRGRADLGCDCFLRPTVNTSLQAWGPRPCGPQSQKTVATRVVWTADAMIWDSCGSDTIWLRNENGPSQSRWLGPGGTWGSAQGAWEDVVVRKVLIQQQGLCLLSEREVS